MIQLSYSLKVIAKWSKKAQQSYLVGQAIDWGGK
tara:strand:+ start:470 stop:571 length:102 start_codon:yes stop_codon:yes gene_type:complete